MNREIKFRAWHKNHKVMYEVLRLCFDDALQIVLPIQGYKSDFSYCGYEDVELMQYTCLKDKNGKEIYERDILRCISKDGFEHKSTISLGWSEDDEYGWCWNSGSIVRKVDFISDR